MGKNDRLRRGCSAFRRRALAQEQLWHARKDRSKRHNNNMFDGSDDESTTSVSSGTSDETLTQKTEIPTAKDDKLWKLIDALYVKRGSTREKALSGLVDSFENHTLEFLDNKYVTLLHQFLKSIKQGSSKESSLAYRAIGLLSITIGCGSSAHEIMEESIPHLSQALTSGSGSLNKSSILDCLAVISFVGGADVVEKEKAMNIVWELIYPKSGSHVMLSKPPFDVLATAISSWSLILSSLNPWSINSYKWQESLSHLSSLLDMDDHSVCIAAGEAIALILEIGRLDKFCKEESNDNEGMDDLNIKNTTGQFSYVQSLKRKIVDRARNLCVEAGAKGSAKSDLVDRCNVFKDIVALIETNNFPEYSLKIFSNCQPLVVSTWTQLLQLNFLRRFLGHGFLKHMKENELLHDVFDFTPRKTENVLVKEKTQLFSPNSLATRERTQFMNKRRTWTNDRKQGHFTVGAFDA